MNSEIIKTFSAKDLCSRSCMQIKMFAEHPEVRPQPNGNMNNGVSFQHEIALSTEGLIGEEMRGYYISDGICINFANDIVCKNKIMEVKSLNREAEEWYFNSCVLQCAFYSALLHKSNKKLITAKFYSDMGNPVIETTIDNDFMYLLRFGNDTYKIDVTDNDFIVEFFLNKAKASLEWDTAKEFDKIHKHKEYSELKDYFIVTKQ